MSAKHSIAPPSSLGSEESLLGCLLLQPTIMRDIAGVVDVSDFYKPNHQHIYNAIHVLHFTGQAIDAITVCDQLRREGLLEEVTPELVLGAQNSTPAISNWKRYADTVVDNGRRRATIEQLAWLTQAAYDYSLDIDTVIAEAGMLTGNHKIAKRANDVIPGLSSLAEMAARVDAKNAQGDLPWIVPHILKPGWRIILVAGEGVGKATLMRYLGIHAACGIDPWDDKLFVEPRRVMYLDTENEEETIIHQVRIANRTKGFDPIAQAEDRFSIYHREGGVDLRNRRDLAEFESALQRHHPEILLAGPLYKLYRRHAREDMEMAALEFTEILDDLRTRYNFALILEHHAPKASSGAFRELNPFGSSLFMRWPVIGLTVDFEGAVDHDSVDYRLNVGRFRRDRVVNDWPQALDRSSQSKFAFNGYWSMGRREKLYRAARLGL